ncbi:hypothetical protein DSLASN_30290 [Desulfoluna limicola]|uniref:Uncharacterized protein n=1 Tax=Desulfoluna limicola TaxID=2810562 RepID=A0ABM7PIK1_9BACT|nr:hypothetical protein DSLASN_30290 [Desulfoluna limicola]
MPHESKGITKRGRTGIEGTCGSAWDNLSSSIRTLTVGSGITPDLLSPDRYVPERALAGLP